MAPARLMLVAIFIALLVPSAGFSQEQPIRPDYLAELLPADAMVYVELSGAPQIVKDWKEYVGAFCTKEGKDKVCGVIEEALKGISQSPDMKKLPEKLAKDLEEGFPTLQQAAFALSAPRKGEEDERFALVFTSSDAGFFKKLVDDLKVFSVGEREYQGFQVLSIRKLGEEKFERKLLLAAPGNRLVMTTDPVTMNEMLDRAAGKAAGEDLRKSEMYRKFAPPPADTPYLRAFFAINWDEMFEGLGGSWRSKRAQREDFDRSDAAFELKKIQGVTNETFFRPGKVSARTRLHVDPTFPVPDLWQPGGPRETLAFVPADAQLVAHMNVKSGDAVWQYVKSLFERWEEVEKKARPEKTGSVLEDFGQEMQKEMGFGPDDLAAAIGDEAAFAMVGEDAFDDPDKSILIVLKATDAEKARGLIEKWTAKNGRYDASKEDDADLFFEPKNKRAAPAIALKGKACLLGGATALRAAIKASKEGVSVQMPMDATPASGFLAVKNRALWKFLQMSMGRGGGLPDLSKDLDLEQWGMVTFGGKDDPLSFSSADAGQGWLYQMTVPLGVVGYMAFSRAMRSMPFGEPFATPEETAEQQQEPAALPADKLAERVKALVEDLRSEEPATRDDAARALKALGRQAAKQVADVLKVETDAEVRERLMNILLAWKAYDVLPDVLARKVEAFIGEFAAMTTPDKEEPWARQPFISWNSMDAFPEAIEPRWVNLVMLMGLQDRDIVEVPAGLAAIAERIGGDKLPIETQRNLAGLLAYVDCTKAGDAVLAAYKRASDPEMKVYLTIALGWCGSGGTDAIVEGLKSADRPTSRASFIAAERTKDPAVVGRLIGLLKDEDHETRWNASYTLRKLTGGKANVNVYWPDKRYEEACAAAAEWWEKNKK